MRQTVMTNLYTSQPVQWLHEMDGAIPEKYRSLLPGSACAVNLTTAPTATRMRPRSGSASAPSRRRCGSYE